ncbi:MAG: HAMP domain-containing histidine kinase [Hyphomicrobiaceae bacterium]|nr:MAG: HAMP domain-containing histidine kinase [Hyphomicrobiaceae bacterium]
MRGFHETSLAAVAAAPPAESAVAIRVPWLSHIAVRSAAVLVVATLLPLLVVIAAYDRYATSLLDIVSGARIEQRLAISHGRVAGFLEARFAQLDTLATHPDVTSLARSASLTARGGGVRALLEYEADNPDLYGVLLFDGSGSLVDAIPSQAAAGVPYWGGRWQPLKEEVPRSDAPRGRVVGPFLPADGRPGSLLLVRQLPTAGGMPAAAIALHVRLSSLTEALGQEDARGLFKPLMLTPGGLAFSPIGRPERPTGNIMEGPELLPGWRVALAVETRPIVRPLSTIREALLGAAVAVAALVAGVVVVLGSRLNRRIGRLVESSAALAEGRLDSRVSDDGRDELTVLARAFNRMAARQRDTLNAAVEAEKMAVLGRFASSFAHEVKNPLAAMKTTVQGLLARNANEEHRRLLEGMDDEIDRLDGSLRDFLVYARPAPASPRRVVVEEVLARCETLISHQLKDAGIKYVALGETNLALRTDIVHLQQILMNLIANAIDAMPDGGRITLRVRRSIGSGIIEVSDTGHGIPEAMIDHVMEPFVSTRKDGAGLGLAISRQLAEINGGKLAIASEAGQGTTVTLSLPRDEEACS